MTNTYHELTDARAVLELPEQTTLTDIKAQYRKLLKQWHPDTCPEPPEQCHEMTRKIIAAYTRIMAYCNSYKISFTQETVHDYLSPEEWWMERFGDDPVWGVGRR
ncbi:heat shock protein DnaJ domain protein [Candidatus Vecturithrix granuli]|uniref:Heat shock protein DnaJ domain protein n=1 Tax=Vecturithrix granuli TaxID=1499967 RepID=A0A081BWX5_VECG1|nr:heat shock protein DnaJ domain protein [Candidatus Vecturithrix granuli]